MNAGQLAAVISAIDTANQGHYVVQENGKGLSTNDFDNTYKGTLDNLSDTLSGKVDTDTYTAKVNGLDSDIASINSDIATGNSTRLC